MYNKEFIEIFDSLVALKKVDIAYMFLMAITNACSPFVLKVNLDYFSLRILVDFLKFKPISTHKHDLYMVELSTMLKRYGCSVKNIVVSEDFFKYEIWLEFETIANLLDVKTESKLNWFSRIWETNKEYIAGEFKQYGHGIHRPLFMPRFQNCKEFIQEEFFSKTYFLNFIMHICKMTDGNFYLLNGGDVDVSKILERCTLITELCREAESKVLSGNYDI